MPARPASSSTWMRAASVLMKRPTMACEPISAGGRPETTVPNTTSRWPA